FAPCRVTTLNTAPTTLPYSAGAPSCRTSISWMASAFGHGQAVPPVGADRSVPSMAYRLSLVLLPSTVADVEDPSVDVALTPGAELTRSKNEKCRIGAAATHVWL